MQFQQLFEKVYSKQNLTLQESREAVLEMMDGRLEVTRMSALITALHMKGETADELAGFALAMLDRAIRIPLNGLRVMDTCGTGGDRKGSFNISTISAFVLAGAGIPVLKHGNRAASSVCGSADLLAALEMRYRLKPEEVSVALEKTGFAFLFAPDYHPAAKTVASIRKQLGVPTIFNLLGPLTNPGRPHAQIIGIYDENAIPLVAEAFQRIDPQRRALFIHSSSGWDEAIPCCEFILHPAPGNPKRATAQLFGIPACNESDLLGGSPKRNAEIALSVLQGKPGPYRNTVLLNAALGYQLRYPGSSCDTAIRSVERSIDSGESLRVVQKYQELFSIDEQS